MSNTIIGSRINGGNTAYNRCKADYYPTPPECTTALLNFLHIPKSARIWEPAAGGGHIVDVLKEQGYDVVSTDIITGVDFLTAEKPENVSWIITNPPFSLAEEFIRTAFDHKVSFAYLLKSQFWNAKKRYKLFNDCKPTYILPLTWRPDFLFKTRGNGSPLIDVNWCVWDADSCSKTTEYIPLCRPIST